MGDECLLKRTIFGMFTDRQDGDMFMVTWRRVAQSLPRCRVTADRPPSTGSRCEVFENDNIVDGGLLTHADGPLGLFFPHFAGFCSPLSAGVFK